MEDLVYNSSNYQTTSEQLKQTFSIILIWNRTEVNEKMNSKINFVDKKRNQKTHKQKNNNP